MIETMSLAGVRDILLIKRSPLEDEALEFSNPKPAKQRLTA